MILPLKKTWVRSTIFRLTHRLLSQAVKQWRQYVFDWKETMWEKQK
jgi:hypothetical protein